MTNKTSEKLEDIRQLIAQRYADPEASDKGLFRLILDNLNEVLGSPQKTRIERVGDCIEVHPDDGGARTGIFLRHLRYPEELKTSGGDKVKIRGWSFRELADLIEGPARSPIDHIREVADATVDAMAKEQPKAVPLPLSTRNEDDGEWRRGINLRELQTSVHDLAREKGWWDGYDRDDLGQLKLTTDQVISKIALIHAELSEAVEEARKSPNYSKVYYDSSKPEGFAIELADALIRILDLFGGLGIDAAEAVRIKLVYNRTRPHRHGGKLA